MEEYTIIGDKGPYHFSLNNIVDIDAEPRLRETDRGCVLICFSDLENDLNSLLTCVMNAITSLSKKDEHALFDYRGALSSFNSRLLIAKAFGLIDNTLYRDMDTLRKVRNSAAHNPKFSLSDSAVHKQIESIQYKAERMHAVPVAVVSAEGKVLKTSDVNEHVMKGYGLVTKYKFEFLLACLGVNIQLNEHTIKVMDSILKIKHHIGSSETHQDK